MSIFCRHSYILLKQTTLNHYWDTLPYYQISYQIKIICEKCGKVKIFETNKIITEPYYSMGGYTLNNEQQIYFEINKNIIIQKIQKKYRFKKYYNWHR